MQRYVAIDLLERKVPGMNPVKKVRKLLVTVEPHRNGFEQLCPDQNLRIGDWQVMVNPVGAVEADFWIVFGNARPADQIKIARENTLLVVLEPEAKKVYPRRYYRQFQWVVDTHEKSGHPNLMVEAPCFSWHVGLRLDDDAYHLGYDELSRLACPEKRKNKISVVCSDAMHTEGQRKRLVFLEGLKSRLGDKIEHFGRGFCPIEDKMEGILGYRLHLVMENCLARHYWTEKLIDSYLGWAFPVYLGCPNLADYFPKAAYGGIDTMDPGLAAEAILARLEQVEDSAEREGLLEGRRRVLEEYNPFVRWVGWASAKYNAACEKEWLTLRSHKAYRPYLQGELFKYVTGGKRATGRDKERLTHG